MSRRLTRILDYVGSKPWAIHPTAASRMMSVIARRIEGRRLSQAEIDDAIGADRDDYEARREMAAATLARTGNVAVVPVYGTILGRDWEFTQASHGGTTSSESLIRELARLDADASVSSVVLDIDSPGGSVANLPELATQIAGMKTRTVAQVNGMAASAAYWIATQADQIVATPSAEVGSIGVYTMHQDAREALAAEGVSVEIIRAGANKIAANPYEELSDDARADLQASVDEYHGMFVAAVASGRGTTAARVRSEFGDGKVFRAKDAKKRGMVDKIATLDETLARLVGGGRSGARGRAEDVGAPDVVADVTDAPADIETATDAVRAVPCLDDAPAAEAPRTAADEIEIRRRRLAY